MIHFILKVGNGTRKAPTISDDLITDDDSAAIRAAQELAKSTYIVTQRVLEMPHDPYENHAYVTPNFAYQALGITGRHMVVSRTITLSPTWCGDSATLEQYTYLEMP